MHDTRRPAPDARPVALTIAGSDSGGGAGIQADVKTMEASGVFATSVITSVTAQNTLGVESTHVLPRAEIEAQLDAVVDDFDLQAVKTGMLATAPIVELVADRARTLDAPLVVDPVMVAASGDRLLEPEAEAAYEDLIAASTLVTPNAHEAEVLTGTTIEEVDDAIAAGETLVAWGVEAALVKGGHVPGDRIQDVLVGPDGVEVFQHPRVETDATHGSGCALSSAIAARLAHGRSLQGAVQYGVDLLSRAVRYPLDVGAGPGAVHHLVELRDRAAREPTAEHVTAIVERLVEADARPLVPEVGMNVVGATPYAESADEVAAVEGRITRTRSGISPNRGVRFGASSHVARFLLAAREVDPALRFAANCRVGDDVEDALETLGWTVARFDRSEQPPAVEAAEGSTMGWGARRAIESVGTTPDAVVDRGAVGKEPMTRLLAEDHAGLADRASELLAELDA